MAVEIGMPYTSFRRAVERLGLAENKDAARAADVVAMLKAGASVNMTAETLRHCKDYVRAVRDTLIGGDANRPHAALILALPDHQRQWLLSNIPRGGSVVDLLSAIITDAMEDE